MRSSMVVASVAAIAMAGVACGGGESSSSAPTTEGSQLPEACAEVPFTMQLQAFTPPPTGSAELEITDAVARRVPILPNADTASDAAQIQAQADEAAATDFALYNIYVADFPIDRSPIEGYGFGEVEPEPGGTLGVISIIPPTTEPLAAGDVITDGELAYETVTTFAPVSLTVESTEHPLGDGYSDVAGQVEILHLDDEQLCVAVDLELTNAGEPVVTGKGTFVAPIVRADRSFYFR